MVTPGLRRRLFPLMAETPSCPQSTTRSIPSRRQIGGRIRPARRNRHRSRSHPGLGMTPADVVIIGAGHNGLVAANYLAKAGLGVVVVERADRVGGACVTDAIAPGFKVSAAAYVSGLV